MNEVSLFLSHKAFYSIHSTRCWLAGSQMADMHQFYGKLSRNYIRLLLQQTRKKEHVNHHT